MILLYLALMYNCPRAATVIATSESTVCKLNRLTFRQILAQTDSATQHIGHLRTKFVKRAQSICASQADMDEFHQLTQRSSNERSANAYQRLYNTPTQSFDSRFAQIRVKHNAQAQALCTARLRPATDTDGNRRVVLAHQYNIIRAPSSRYRVEWTTACRHSMWQLFVIMLIR